MTKEQYVPLIMIAACSAVIIALALPWPRSEPKPPTITEYRVFLYLVDRQEEADRRLTGLAAEGWRAENMGTAIPTRDTAMIPILLKRAK